MLAGVWGGTTEAERVALGDVPIGEAVERLERSFPVRLATVARVFERSRARRVARLDERPGPGSPSQSVR
jgi:hypothetical protein